MIKQIWLHSWGTPLAGLSVNTDLLLVLPSLLVLHQPVNLGKEGVVLSHTHILPWVKAGPLLADKDVSGLDPLAAITFDSRPLSSAIPAVPRASSCFLVCDTTLLLNPSAKGVIA